MKLDGYAFEMLSMASAFQKLTITKVPFKMIGNGDGLILRLIELSCEENEPIKMSQVSKRLCISRSAVTQAVTKLVEKGYINKTPSVEDKKSILLELTPLGKQVLSDEVVCIRKFLDRVLTTMGEEDTVLLLNLIKKIYKIMSEMTEEE